MTTPLQDAFSLFYFPFRITADLEVKLNSLSYQESIWTKSSLRIEEEYFFNHVRDYFNHNAGLEDEELMKTDITQCVIFELKSALSKTRAGASLEKVFTIPMRIKHGGYTFNCAFRDGTKRSILSPKLVIVPQSSIGVISFSLGLEGEENTLEELIDFNYALRALYGPHRRAPRLEPRDENLHERRVDLFRLGLTMEEREEAFFSLGDLLKLLIGDFAEEEYLPLSPKHFHLFSYVHLGRRLKEPALGEALFALSRVYNANYNSPFGGDAENPEVIHTFADIYAAVSQEGGCFLRNAPDKFDAATVHFDANVVKSRYLWIYLLAYLQRITLINTAYTISDLLKGGNYSMSEITKTIQLLSRIQLRGMFSQVSNISMHNQFYDLARKSFRIPTLFAELKEEIHDLNMIVRQEEARNRTKRDELALRQEKEAARRRDEDQEKQKRFEQRLNVILFILGLLTFLSVWKDFADIIDGGLNRIELLSFVQLIFVIALALGVVYFVRRSRRKP